MPIQRVVYPSGFTKTPKAIARALGVPAMSIGDFEHRFVLNSEKPLFSESLLLAPPTPSAIRGIPDDYEALRELYRANKRDQRLLLQLFGFPTPLTHETPNWPENGPPEGSRWIVRPLNHFGGAGWQTGTNGGDGIQTFDIRNQYVSLVYPRKWEYRVLLSFGKRIATLFKRPPADREVSQLEPWNHANGFKFVTVNNPENDRLRNTNLYSLLDASEVLKVSPLVALDILLADRTNYVVCEINFAPALGPINLQKVVTHVSSCTL